MCLELAAKKVLIQFPGHLGDCDVAIEELMQDRFLKSVDIDIRMRITHRIDGVPANEWPGYYKLVEFRIEKEKEILVEKQQCKETTYHNLQGISVF